VAIPTSVSATQARVTIRLWLRTQRLIVVIIGRLLVDVSRLFVYCPDGLYQKQFHLATIVSKLSEMSEMAPGPPAIHGALTKHTGFLLSRMGMVAMKQFSLRLEELGLNTRMWGALNVLDAEGAITQHMLGKSTGIDPSSMVGTIDELERAGLVERRRHPSDRRAHALHITELGHMTLAQGRKLAKKAQDDLLAPLDADERKQLHDLLLRLALATASVRPGDSR
jgi:DNA-binding MarR family transcriptional regulator